MPNDMTTTPPPTPNATPNVIPVDEGASPSSPPPQGSGPSPKGDTPPLDRQEVIADLQAQNDGLQQQIEQLQAARTDPDDTAARLELAAEENDQLRDCYAQLSLRESLRKAADTLGLAGDVVGLYGHRFHCTVTADGGVRIEPNPTEFLVEQLRNDPLLARAAEKGQQRGNAEAVVHGIRKPETADPVQLLAVLDGDPKRKARFVAKHGAEALLDLARRAGHAERGSR